MRWLAGGVSGESIILLKLLKLAMLAVIGAII